MQLTMQAIAGVAEDLPPHDNTMTTGPMGDCVSIIVLWGFAAGRAANVRGFHGFGGLGAINMISLFNGVPDEATTQVHCIFGSLASEGGDPRRAPGAIAAHVQNVTVTYHNLPNASVTRNNVVTRA